MLFPIPRVLTVPGENIVNGQRWLYIRNSTDGVARISDGKLYISGNSYDRILFLDQVYDHINYRFSMSVNYTEAPEKATVENEQKIGADGYVGGIFNLQEADGSGDRNAVITAITPDNLYLKQVIFKEDGTIQPKDERGDCPIGTKAEDNLWSQYWSAVQPGSTFYLYTYSGISGFSNGNFCSIPRDMSLNSKGWGNCYGVSKDYRTGVMGIFLGEGQASAYIDDIQVEVAGTLIKVDGEDFPIWGDGEISIADLQRKGEKLLYAIVDGVVKLPNETINATRKTKITTAQVTLSTRKVVAVGETGLKWRTEIGKADYDRLKSDENVKSIQLGTVVVPTSMISAGLTRETSGVSDIAAASEWSATSETTYTFEGVRSVAKAERDISYSGIGYLTVIMQDDTAFTVYADYVTRNHAYALSDLVSEFHDTEDEPASASDQQGTTPAGNDPVVQNETIPEQSGKKKGCGSTVGTSAFFLLIALSGMCVVIRKKKERERS